MSKKKKKKIRAEFRKKHDQKKRRSDLTRKYESNELSEDMLTSERVSGKGDLTRRRTIVGSDTDAEETGLSVQIDVDQSEGFPGRVLSVHGLNSFVRVDGGDVYQCAVSGVLKSLSTEQRHVVAAGDRVFIRVVNENEGMIQRIEPRRGTICRTSKGRQHVIVANVDQLLIVGSAAEPSLKPNLIDRFLVTAEKSEIKPIICINKTDLVNPADLQPIAGVYGQMGYDVILLSAKTGFGIERLRARVANKESVVAGQSGVGKSSLLNAIEPGLDLAVKSVSTDNQKGRHTTTAARLTPLSGGGFIVDTPGIRQFQLWDVIPEEVEGYFRDLRPFINFCKYPNCTHTHEADCAVKDAVADGKLDARRYESYCHLFQGDMI